MLNLLYKNFNITTTSLLKTGDKTIDQIQSILQSKEAKNLSKRAIGDIGNLAMASKDKGRPKRKANSNNECYNCHKFGYFEQDCLLPNRRLNRNIQQSWREESWKRDLRREHQSRRQNDSRATPNRAYQTPENKIRYKDTNSDSKPFVPRTIRTLFMVKE